MNMLYKVLLIGVIVGSVGMATGFYIGSNIDTSHLYKESAFIQK